MSGIHLEHIDYILKKKHRTWIGTNKKLFMPTIIFGAVFSFILVDISFEMKRICCVRKQDIQDSSTLGKDWAPYLSPLSSCNSAALFVVLLGCLHAVFSCYRGCWGYCFNARNRNCGSFLGIHSSQEYLLGLIK